MAVTLTTEEVRARLEGYPSAIAAEMGHLWDEAYARKRATLDDLLAQSAPRFFGRRQWRARRDRLRAELGAEYAQVRAALVDDQLDRIADIRRAFSAREVYGVLGGRS